MAKLVLTLDGSYVNEYALTHLKTTIGRKSSSDIHLDNLAISGEHAVILKQGDDFFIQDLNSTNGTRVNATVLTTKHQLNDEDVIVLGRFSLTFLDQDVGAGASFEKTMMVHPSALIAKAHTAPAKPVVEPIPVEQHEQQPVIVNEPASDVSPAPPVFVGKIQVLNGNGNGRELVLNKTLTTLGKTGVQVAVITKRPNGYFITHVEGKVLPVVNGVPTGLQAHALVDHDVIELAGVKMEFYLSHA